MEENIECPLRPWWVLMLFGLGTDGLVGLRFLASWKGQTCVSQTQS